MDSRLRTKSGLMVGAGETWDEVLATMRDLRSARCDMLTVGQYLAPSEQHYPIARYYTPDEFEGLKRIALELGFSRVESAPLVRSSYHAGRGVMEQVPRRVSQAGTITGFWRDGYDCG